VIIDVETGGFNADTDGLLEIAAVPLTLLANGRTCATSCLHAHIYNLLKEQFSTPKP
jgi:ribonuclease T